LKLNEVYQDFELSFHLEVVSHLLCFPTEITELPKILHAWKIMCNMQLHKYI